MKDLRLNKNIMCIDLKSFYASVECADKNLDPFKTLLVVADKSRGMGTICLALTPAIKKLGVGSRPRLYEIPKKILDKTIICKPHMKKYMEKSIEIIKIYLKYVSYEDILIYSIDECFLDLTPYLKYNNKSDLEMAKIIADDVFKQTKISVSIGLGPNMLMAKLAMDIEAKNKKNRIAKWTYSDVKTKLWKVIPLSNMWGIGSKMQFNLNKLGIKSVGDLANFDLNKLEKLYGVMGKQLYYHAHGIDNSNIQDKNLITNRKIAFSAGQVLFSNYNYNDTKLIILEMVDELCFKLRCANKLAKTFSLSITYSDHKNGFSRQTTLEYPTYNQNEIYKELLVLFDNFYDKTSLIREVHVSATKLYNPKYEQISFFYFNKNRDDNLSKTIDNIKQRFGKNSINRASSLLKKSTVKQRNKQIGGHNE